MSRHSSGEDLAGALVMGAIMLTIVVMIAIGAALAAGAKEIGTVYADHAATDSPYRRILLTALAVLAAVGLVLLLVGTTVAGAATACVVTFAWALFVYVITVEGVNLVGRRHLKDGSDLASYLDFDTASPVNGRRTASLP